MHRRRTGFTLIELLIVVVIIGILAAIAVPRFRNSKDKAYLANMKSDLRNLAVSEEGFYVDSMKYTSTLTQLVYRTTSGVTTPTLTAGPGYWSATVSHTQLPGSTCGIAINTTNPIDASAGEGAPACYSP